MTRDDVSVDHEEEMRELLVTQAQSFARDSLDELDLIEQVIISRYTKIDDALLS
jgi:hypothetical protein